MSNTFSSAYNELLGRWHAATLGADTPVALTNEVVSLAEQMLAEARRTGDGTATELADALTHHWEVGEFSNTPDLDLRDSTDRLLDTMSRIAHTS